MTLFAAAGVLDGDAEAPDGRTDNVLLERTEAAAGGRDLLDRLVDDLLGGVEVVAVDDVERLARAQLVEEPEGAGAQLAGRDVAEMPIETLSPMLTVEPSWKSAPPPVMVKAVPPPRVSGVERAGGGERDLDVEEVGVDAQGGCRRPRRRCR
jgi:hypothetical protein